MHALQAQRGFQVELVGAHGEVTAFDERHAEIARHEGMLEVGFVARPRREQGHAGTRAFGREACEALHDALEARGQALHGQIAEGLGELLRNDQPVLQQIAEARGRLRALAGHAPQAVGPSHEFESDLVQVRVT